MSQLGFWFDMTRCVGCKACQVACKEEKGLPPGGFFRRVELHPRLHFRYSGACNHCAEPACARVCPTGAMYRSFHGLVLHDDAACIGCGRCVHACPYGAPFLDETTGLSRKCDACGGAPVCVAACPTRALDFGSPEELRARHGEGSGLYPAFLPPPQETSPVLRVDGLSGQLGSPGALSEQVSPSTEPELVSRRTARTYIVLGAGAAGVTAVRELRRRDPGGRILLISDEPGLPYSRPMLSKALLRGFRRERYELIDSLWLEENRVELIAGASVAGLDPHRHTVTLADGRQYVYDKCIYALGAEASVPPVPGVGLEGVFTLRKMADIQALRLSLPAVRQGVVVGGGAIGLEAACHLAGHGIAVTVVESMPHLMERQLGLRLSATLQTRLEAAGVTVLTGAALESIQGKKGAVESVVLKDRVIPAQLVLLSTGVRPNTAIAQAAGLAVGRCVEVEATMETGVPDLYACGDCAACRGQGESTWLHAQRQAVVAAINAAGDRREAELGPAPLLLHAAGLSLFSIGTLDGGEERCVLHGSWDASDGLFRVNSRMGQRRALLSVCFTRGRLTGAAVMGDLTLSAWLEKAVDHQMAEEPFLSAAIEKGVEFLER